MTSDLKFGIGCMYRFGPESTTPGSQVTEALDQPLIRSAGCLSAFTIL